MFLGRELGSLEKSDWYLGTMISETKVRIGAVNNQSESLMR